MAEELARKEGELVIPLTGEVFDLTEPDQAVLALAGISNLQAGLAEMKKVVRKAVIDHADREAARTVEWGGVRVEVDAPDQVKLKGWDFQKLVQLVPNGLSTGTFWKLVQEVTIPSWVFVDLLEQADLLPFDPLKEAKAAKVNGQVARTISGTKPEWAEIIREARIEEPKERYVKVVS